MTDRIDSIRTFHDEQAGRYVQERYAGEGCEQYSYRSRKDIALRMLEAGPFRALDVGCGPAVYTRDLLDLGHTLFAVDVSIGMLNTARQVAGADAAVQWTCSEIDRLPFADASFDRILAIGVLAYARNTRSALEELARVLRPGGHAVLQCSNTIAPGPRVTKLKDSFLERLRIRKPWYDFTLTTHTLPAFRRIAAQAGLTVLDHGYYDFRIPFLEKVSRPVAVRSMRMLHRLLSNSRTLGWLGEGYVVKVRRQSSERNAA